MDIERTKQTITESLVKETITRLQNYLSLEGNPTIEEHKKTVLRTTAVRACQDTADFLSGRVVMVDFEEALKANRAEELVPILEDEIGSLRQLVPKTKLKKYDEAKSTK